MEVKMKSENTLELEIDKLKNENEGIYFVFKRIFDFIFSMFLFILTLPIVVLSCLIIFLQDFGQPFYFQRRMGHMGKEFYVVKLRSMKKNAENGKAQWAKKNDNRITKFGKIIRKTRIDELPQLINVIKGDMSLIGPRPERKVFVEEFLIEIPDFLERLAVKPGLTGWAQVNGGYEIDAKEKLELDKYYVENISFLLDLKIFFKTIKVVITGEGAR